MYYQYLDEHAVFRNSTKALHLMKHKQKVLSVILEALKKFNGKKITKRIITAVEQALFEFAMVNGHKNTYVTDLMSDEKQTMSVWGNDIPYDSRIICYLGYKKDIKPFNYDKWFRTYGKAYDITERINNLQEAIKDTNVLVSEYNDAIVKLEQAEYGMRYLVYR